MPSLAGLFFWMNRTTEDINKIIVKKPLKLDCGKTINNFPLAYETYGKLNANKDNDYCCQYWLSDMIKQQFKLHEIYD